MHIILVWYGPRELAELHIFEKCLIQYWCGSQSKNLHDKLFRTELNQRTNFKLMGQMSYKPHKSAESVFECRLSQNKIMILCSPFIKAINLYPMTSKCRALHYIHINKLTIFFMINFVKISNGWSSWACGIIVHCYYSHYLCSTVRLLTLHIDKDYNTFIRCCSSFTILNVLLKSAFERCHSTQTHTHTLKSRLSQTHAPRKPTNQQTLFITLH